MKYSTAKIGLLRNKWRLPPLAFGDCKDEALPKRDIIVVGGSAGAPAALRQIVGALSPNLDAAVFVVTHVPLHGSMLLAGLLDALAGLPVAYAQDGDEIQPGRILLAPPDRHLMLSQGGVRLGLGPRENFARPAIDPLFRSAAATFGSRVVGVILTGMLNDGAAGLWAVKYCGGATVVQDPLDASVPDMPRAALRAVDADYVVEAGAIAPLIESLAREEAPLGRPPSSEIMVEVETALGRRLGTQRLERFAEPSTFSCPNCQGVLSRIKGEGPLRYRCQIGHAITGAVLEDRQSEALEQALGVALRIVEERVGLMATLIEDARAQGQDAAADLHEIRAAHYAEQAEVLRRAVVGAVAERNEPDDDAERDATPRVA